jgi:aspartate/methionine/tyrosine aminotransferase
MFEKTTYSKHSSLISEWEHKVEYNLAESATLPLSIEELLDCGDIVEELLSTKLSYPQTNGTIELRERIAAIYPNASPDNIIVTIGAAQANFTTILTMLEPGDEIILMPPTYMQANAIANKFGFNVKLVMRKEETGWGIDIEGINQAISNKTKLIFVCNPNNPTGYILSSKEMEAVINVADRVGAWILADEVCSGTERVTDEITPSFWNRYPRVLATSSMSKLYGIPGVRIGWVIAPNNVADAIWKQQSYMTISASMVGNKLAEYALLPDVRTKLIKRARHLLRLGYNHLNSWVEKNSDLISLIPPKAMTNAFIRYHTSENSVDLVNRLIHDKSTLVIPGDYLGADQHLRVSFNLSENYLLEGLNRIIQAISNK